MSVRPSNMISRRRLIAGGGAVVVWFGLSRAGRAVAQDAAQLPGSLKKSPLLDSWIRIDATGKVTVFTGKSELGQGIKTALVQIAAEELSVPAGQVELVTSDTAQTPNEGFTSGSQSMSDSGTAILNAAAQVREILVDLAAERWQLPADALRVAQGSVEANDGRKASYADLVKVASLHVKAKPTSIKKDPKTYTLVGTPMQRVDIPAKVSGGAAYIQDMRMPGLVHARVVQPPSYGATLRAVATSEIEGMPGVLKVYRDQNYLAVIADDEYRAVKAADALSRVCVWEQISSLPEQSRIYDHLKSLPSEDSVILDRGIPSGASGKTLRADYQRPYQMHGSIGPSCAIGLYKDDFLTVWSHGQGMYPMRKSLAELLNMQEERIRCIHVEGSGCYGHNGADDAGADAAILARVVPGRPVRVQWTREQEHASEPFGPAMSTAVRATLDGSGSVVDWQYEVWSNAHSTRPGGAGNMLAGRLVGNAFTPPAPEQIPQPAGGGDRNAIPLYNFPNARVTHHFIPEMPLRVSALRSLGAYMNVFSIESFMDELAQLASTDPVEFRMRHLVDMRAKEVVQAAAEKFGWLTWRKEREGQGKGFAFAKYKNIAAYCAIALDLEVERDTGRVRLGRAVAVDDSGQAVNPDGIRNQIEGAIVQSASWTLFEEVRFDRSRILSRDWASYPILRFTDLFKSVDVDVINRPGQPFLGTGEAGQGPTCAAIANAVADASGARIRQLPLTPARILSARAQD